ncbi:MAG: nucleotidyltransferase family protein [Actinomycetota bacterium]|nr:nucleotidyltransferase family protein [Actinomycetota bacterium]
MIEHTAGQRIAVRTAAIGLPGANGEDPVSVPEDDWPNVLSKLSSQRLTGLALAGVDSGELLLADGQLQDLLDRHRQSMSLALELERVLVAVGSRFAGAGLEFVVLKGPALARSFYPDPTLRPFVDLDLLVRTRDWRRACDLLAELGYQRVQPEPRSGFDERFGKAAAHRSAKGLWIDLHRTLVVGPFGLWLDPEELFEGSTPLVLADRTFRRLADTTALLHACMHASLGLWPPLLLPVRDVAQVSSVGDLDWELFLERARRWRLQAVVRHAFRTDSDVLGLPPPQQAREVVTEAPRARESRALEAYFGGTRSRGVALATLHAIPGIRAKGAYIRALLLPQRDFLAVRAGRGRRASYLRRWLVPFRWFASRPRDRKSLR